MSRLSDYIINNYKVSPDQANSVVELLPTYLVEEFNSYADYKEQLDNTICMSLNMDKPEETHKSFDEKYFELSADGHLRCKLKDVFELGRVPQPIGYTDYSYMFEGCKFRGGCDLSHWDMSTITCLKGMFRDAHIGRIRGLDTWDVSNVTDFSEMFMNFINSYRNGLNQDLSKWDLRNASTVVKMFYGALVGNIGIEHWQLVAGTYFDDMVTKTYRRVDYDGYHGYAFKDFKLVLTFPVNDGFQYQIDNRYV